MKYLILSLFSLNAFAQSAPLITLDQFSGYTPPQYAMEAHCALESYVVASSGKAALHAVSKIFKNRTGTDDGWKVEMNSETSLTAMEEQQVLAWINEAKAGPFKTTANPCDIGTLIIKTSTYPIIVSNDCGKRTMNLHPSAAKLVSFMRRICNLEGTTR